MKKILAFCGCMVVLFLFCVPAQAYQYTITFDEYPAYNGTPIPIDLYADQYLWFADPLGSTHRASTYDPGTWSLPVTTQFLGVESFTGDYGTSAGWVLEFNVIECLRISFTAAIAEGTTTSNQNLVLMPVYSGTPIWGGITEIPLKIGVWKDVEFTLPATYDHGFEALVMYVGCSSPSEKAYLAMDDLQYELVPIPASALLLASGLIPLIRLRRKT